MRQLLGPIDIGSGVTIESFTYANDEQDLPVGMTESHPGKNDERCHGSVRFDTPEAHAAYSAPGPHWQVESWVPLTISPSILCMSCGHHGYIRNGKWVSA